MAWIESHQELARHPKTRRLARLLGVPIPAVIGYLHLLWWWAVDYAEDGDLSLYEAEDIADACMWEDDADRFVSALVDCGPTLGHGFLDRAEGGALRIHDWMDYAGRLIQQRRTNAQRTRRWREQHEQATNTEVTPNAHVTHNAPIPNATTGPDMTGHDTTKPDVIPLRGAEAPAKAPRKVSAKPSQADVKALDREDRAMWAVMLKVWRVPENAKPTQQSRDRWNAAIKELRQAEVKPDDLPGLAERYEELFGKLPPTPHAIVTHILELRATSPPSGGSNGRRAAQPTIHTPEVDDDWARRFDAAVSRGSPSS